MLLHVKGKSNKVLTTTGTYTSCGNTVVHFNFFRNGVKFRPNMAFMLAVVASSVK